MAAGERRERLIRPLVFLLMTGAVAAVLVLLFPRHHEFDFEAMAEVHRRATLGDPEIRLKVAGEHMRAGRYAEAWEVLGPLLQGKRPSLAARLLALDLAVAERNSLADGHPRRAVLLARVNALMDGLVREVPRERLEPLARLALELGRPAAAAEIYLRLGELAPAERVKWLAEAGRWFLAAGAGERAAAAYGRASDEAKGRGEAITYGIAAAKALLGAGRGQEALALADRLAARFPKHGRVLDVAIDVARAQGDVARARTWAEARAEMSPSEERVLLRLLDALLAAGDVQAAVGVMQRIVALRPGDVAYRRRLAEIAGWAGRRDVLLETWAWLARHQRTREDIERTYGLARGLQDNELAVEMLYLLYRQRPPTHPEILALGVLLENLGRPREAERELRAYLARVSDDENGWQTLAYLMERQGDLRGCLVVWEEIARRFGDAPPSLLAKYERSPESGAAHYANKQAEMLWRLRRPREALDRLLAVRERAAPGDGNYWFQVAALATELEDAKVALAALRMLWEGGGGDAETALRLATLEREAGNSEAHYRVALGAWERFRAPRVLLLAMDTAVRESDWARLRTLVGLARREEARFAQFEEYWLLRAQLATHDERHREAQEAYRAALALQPELRAAQVGLLWSLVESDDRVELEAALGRWRDAAAADPVFWAAFAVGYDRLGRLDEALIWYRREARANPGNHEILVRYADALARAGNDTAAWRLRRHVLARMRPRALIAARTPLDARARPLLRTYTALLREVGSDAQARAWIERLRLGAGQDREAQEMLVSWYLDIEQPDEAARWIARLDQERRRSPAWQRLAVALAQNDLRAVSHIVGGEAPALSTGDRVEAEVRLGRDEAALRAVEGAPRARMRDEELLGLGRQAAEVRGRIGNHVEADWRLDVLGPLALDTHQVRGGYGAARGLTVGGRVGFTDLHHETGAFRLGRGAYEVDAAARLAWRRPRTRLDAAVGANLRLEQPAPWAAASLGYDLRQRTVLRVDVAVGEIVTESPALRAAGNRSQGAASLAADITARDYAVLHVAYNQYRGRDFGFVAQGVSADAELGHRVSLSRPALRLRLTGGFVANAHAAALPAGAAALLPPGAGPESMIPARFTQAGFGVQLGEGDPLDSGPGSAGLRYLVDVWVGWAWPPHHLVYHARLGLALPVSRDGAFSASAYYGNDYVGASGQPFEGIQLMYFHRL